LVEEIEVHGWPCKFYENGIVKVGTQAETRFTLRTTTGKHFANLLRSELIKRELATVADLPVNPLAAEVGAAAVALQPPKQ